MADKPKTGENDWRDQPPEENDGQREEGSQAQDVAEDAIKALHEGGVAPVPDAKHYPKEWRPEHDPLSSDAADVSTDVAEAEGASKLTVFRQQRLSVELHADPGRGSGAEPGRDGGVRV